jgi:hypothetical protein
LNLNILGPIVALLLVWNYWLPTFFNSPVLSIGPTDWLIFYYAGKLWLAHQNPYLIGTGSTGFVYPPFALLLFGFFALFDFNFATELWTVTYILMFALALIVLALTIKSDRRGAYFWVAILLSLMSYPLMVMMKLGQCDLFVSSLCILSLASLRLKHSTCSAILLALGTLLQGPAVFLLIFFVIFRRDVRYLARFLIATLLMVGVSLILIPTSLYWTYFVDIVPTLTSIQSEASNQSLSSYLAMAGVAAFTPAVSLLGFLLFAILAFYVSSHKITMEHSLVRADAVFLMNVLLMLLLGPRSWDHTYVWVILPLALFLSSVLTKKVCLAYLTLVGCATFLVNATLIQTFLIWQLNGVELPLDIIGNLVLILLLVVICVRPAAIIREKEATGVA